MVQHLVHPRHDLRHLEHPHPPRRRDGRADSNATRYRRRSLVIRHGILIDDDSRGIKRLLGLFARHSSGIEIQQEQVGIRATGHHVIAPAR